MKVNLITWDSRVIDPVTATDQIRNIVVSNTRIIDPQGEMMECNHVVDASGCTVAPGLIDFHTHVFYEGSGICLRPGFAISQGTAAAVDTGTTGAVTYEAFYKSAIAQSAVRIKSFLTTLSGEQLGFKLCEDLDPCLINLPRMERVIDKYWDNTLGLKIHLSEDAVPDDRGLGYPKRIVDLVEELDNRLGTSFRICVHTTNAPTTAGELAQCLRLEDIPCYCYQGAGNTIATEDGGISPLVLEARGRGVIFDAANGRGNFGVDIVRRALATGLLPGITSSDLALDEFNIPPHAKNLFSVMAKYRTLSMESMDILKVVTAVPIRTMGMEGRIGTSKPGADADAVILRQKDLSFTQKDFRDEELTSHELLVLQMTVCVGEVNFYQSDSFL